MPPTVTAIPAYTIPDNTSTISEQIIEYVQTLLATAPFDPNNPDSPLLFEKVIRGSINDIQRAWTPAAALEEGPEKKEADLWPLTEKRLRLFVNFKVYHTFGNDLTQVGVDQFAMIRYYFGRIVRLLVTDDQSLGGLATDCSEAGNTSEVNGASDTEPGGVVYFDINYRHMHGDMFTGL